MSVQTITEEEHLSEGEAGERRSFERLIERLSHQSVVKHFDAYGDVDWDSDEFRIDPSDPRWELPADDPLAATKWYLAQPPEVRSRIGLHVVAAKMKTGLQFESVLKRGLLEFAAGLPNGAPEFRYVYHEVIEEAQHSLMFQEFVNRTGLPVRGLPKFLEVQARQVVKFGRRFPALFFMFVLGGEDPIDYVQRRELKSERGVHPLLERIMRIHVTEEARHLSFARHYLKNEVRSLGPVRRRVLAFQTPLLLATMAQMMMRPSKDVIRTYAIPREVVREAYTRNPAHRARTADSLRKVRALAGEIGIVTPAAKRLWKALGIWAD